MPELPEVETVARGLDRRLVGRKIIKVAVFNPDLRRRADHRALRAHTCGRLINRVARRGKYLIAELSDKTSLIAHLGMTGGFRIMPANGSRRRHDHVQFFLDDGSSLVFHDPRRFGFVVSFELLPEELEDRGVLPSLGVEPLSEEFTPALLREKLKTRTGPIKNVLIDQKTIAGIGNIYACEALFLAGINPRRKACRIGKAACAHLQKAVQYVLQEAIECGGTTISDFRSLDELEGSFAVSLRVYGKAGKDCPKCGRGKTIRRILLAGRTTFYCPACQR